MKDVQIPSGWHKQTLGDIADIKIGKTPPRDQERFWDVYKQSQNVWLSIKDMTSRYLFDSAEYITDLAIREFNIPVVEKGTILFSFKLTIGKVGIAQRKLRTNEAIAAIKIMNKGEIDNDFLFYGLGHWNLLQDVDQAIKGTTLNKKKLRELEFILPTDPTEQRAIADILSTLDEAIAQSEALVRKYQSIKQGLMSDLLTRGVNGNREQIATPIGAIPKDWELKTIGSIAIYVGSGITPTGGSNVYVNQGVLFIRSQNVTFDGLLLDDVAYINEQTHKIMDRSKIFPHDVLLNITGASIGRCCPFPEGLGEANVNQHVCAIRLPKPSRADAVFLSAILESYIGQSQIDKLNAGGNRQGLNYQQLRSFFIPWAEEKERAQIAEFLETCNATLAMEKQNLLKLQLLKQGLMQDLLSGQVRVKVQG